MTLKTTAILLIVFAAAIGALLLTRGGESNPLSDPLGRSSTDEPPLIRADQLASDLTSITIDDGLRGVLLKLDKVRGRWWVTKPYPHPADARSIDELLNLIGGLTVDTAADLSDKSSAFAPDASFIKLGYEGRDVLLCIGDRRGAGRAIVTTVRDREVRHHLTQATLNELYDTFDLSVFYSPSIDPPLLPELSRIRFDLPEQASALSQANGRWWIEHADQRERALEISSGDRPGLDALISLVGSIELGPIQPYRTADDLAKYGLDDPLVTVRFEPMPGPGSTQQALTLGVGLPTDPLDERRFISVSQTPIDIQSNDTSTPVAVFTAPTAQALALGQPATAFRDPRATSLAAVMIRTLTIDRVDAYRDMPRPTTLELSLPPDGAALLAVNGGEPREVSPQRAARALDALVRLRAESFEPIESDLQQPLATLTIQPRLDGETERFNFYRIPAQTPSPRRQLALRRGDEGVLLLVDAADLDFLFDRADQWFSE